MGHEHKQGSGGSSVTASAFVDDQSATNLLHMQGNSRVLTTLIGVISQTSPGSIIGTAGDTRMLLPGGAVPVNLTYFGSKNAGTTSGSIIVGLDTTSNYFLASQNVANQTTGQGSQGPTAVTGLFVALAGIPAGTSHVVTGAYSESATSGSGGPWYVQLDYYLPNPA